MECVSVTASTDLTKKLISNYQMTAFMAFSLFFLYFTQHFNSDMSEKSDEVYTENEEKNIVELCYAPNFYVLC